MHRLLCLAVSVLLAAPAFAHADDVRVLSAVVKDQTIDHAELILQRQGQRSLQAFTDAGGTAAFDASARNALAQGGSTLIIKKEGYSNLVARCPCAGLTYALSPVMTNLDGLRIVLSWGAEPKDLDSHLVFEDVHVFFSNRSERDSMLDVDHTTGFGPETITIQHKKPGVRYLYAVHDYTHGERQGDDNLSNASNARVFVYVGSSLLRTFNVPRGQKGNTWMVFAIGEDGEFTDLNAFADSPARVQVGATMQTYLKRGHLESRPVVTTQSLSQADTLNQQGEDAYHANNLEESVRLYLEAIDANPEHSQAYSNLGLAYRKLGRDAEAIWANEKSIALAGGSDAAAGQVRASSHYNIGRIYEKRGQFRDALTEYSAAQQANRSRDYLQSIARMKRKLGEP